MNSLDQAICESILVILGSPRDLVWTLLFKKKKKKKKKKKTCEYLNKLPDLIKKLILACVRYEYV